MTDARPPLNKGAPAAPGDRLPAGTRWGGTRRPYCPSACVRVMQITFDQPGDPFQDRRLNRAQVVTPGQGDAEKSTRPRRQCGDLLNRCRSNAPPPERTLVQVPNCRIKSYNSLTGAGLIRSLRWRVRAALAAENKLLSFGPGRSVRLRSRAYPLPASALSWRDRARHSRWRSQHR
jgi:hypothetical protein